MLERLNAAGFNKISDGGWVKEDSRGRLYVSLDQWTEGELGMERLTWIREKIADPIFYGLDFSDMRLCREIIQAIADDPRILVDNDHGTIVSGSEFVRRVRHMPEWDWRME
jgi:hypothetical protein